MPEDKQKLQGIIVSPVVEIWHTASTFACCFFSDSLVKFLLQTNISVTFVSSAGL